MYAPQLELLMAAYFHEDFDGLWEPLEEYLVDSSEEQRQQLLSDIARVLDAVSDDRELDELLERMGNYADLGEDPSAYRSWLQEIARRVASA